MDGTTDNAQAAPEPVDLNQAMQMLNEDHGAPAPGPVEEPAEPAAPEPEPEPEPEPGDGGPAAEPAGVPEEPDDDLMDFGQLGQEMQQRLQQEAIQRTAQRFRENGVQLQSIESLYERDENSGRVTFRNPDDPNRPFESRAQAQAWVDAINGQIQSKFNADVRSSLRAVTQEYAPTLRLIEFGPTFAKLDDDTADVFAEIVEPYSIRDTQGNIVGYSCDLNTALGQAKKIVSRYGSRAAQAEPDPVTTPATDLGGSGSGGGQQSAKAEPKTLEEAFMMLEEEKKRG